jgi:thiamine biosynthesis lipoprotein
MIEAETERTWSRREVLALGVGAFAVSLAPFSFLRRAPIVRRTLPVMGTLAEVVVVDAEPGHARLAIDAAFRELQSVEHFMTRFEGRSDVGRANRLAAGDAVAISEQTARVIEAGLRCAEASDGAFDPCLGRAVALWDVTSRTEPPSGASLVRLAGRHLHRALDLGRFRGAPAVRFEDPVIALDLGGIAKGHGVDRAVAALRDHGIERGLVNAGGDLFALGVSEDGDPWQVGVRDPADPSRVALRLPLADAAVATSGDYLQYFDYGGRRYHHLLDPRSAAPWRTRTHSVTVVADTCLQADAAATAVFGMPPDRADRFLRSWAPGARIAARA